MPSFLQPTMPSSLSVADSPTVARPNVSRPQAKKNDSYEDSVSYAMHPTALFPAATVGRMTAPAKNSSNPDAFLDEYTPKASLPQEEQQQGSPVYSLEAVSIQDPDEDNDQATTKSASTERAASSSVPASNSPWNLAKRSDIVGLGFDYEFDSPVASRRSSGASTLARRVSTGRAGSIDGGKLPSKTMAHRRQSGSKSSFAHLPPSPAAVPPAHLTSASSVVPTVPFPGIGASSSVAAPRSPAAHATSTAGRTPEHATRFSHQSHHSSPSLIAASILRQTRDPDGRDIDMDVAAAADEGTAEALRKLDGLSSPRLSRVFSSSSTPASKDSVPPPVASGSRSRTTSRGAEAGTPRVPTPVRAESEERQHVRRRTKSSASGVSASGSDRDRDRRFVEDDKGSSLLPPSPVRSAGNSPASTSSAVFPSSSIPRSPHLSLTGQHHGHGQSQGESPNSSAAAAHVFAAPSSSSQQRQQQGSRPGSSGYDNNGGDPYSSSSLPSKRGSASSVSLTAASLDSTSGTSFSARSGQSSQVYNGGSGNIIGKTRRSSAGSDVSSMLSSGEARGGFAQDEQDHYHHHFHHHHTSNVNAIPPVPPLPKDWETYTPSSMTMPTAVFTGPGAAGSSSTPTSAQSSPRVPQYAQHQQQQSSGLKGSPHAPEVDTAGTMVFSSNSTSSSNGTSPMPSSSASIKAPRKWSISNAFGGGKSSKSPKSPAIKESASFSDLLSAPGEPTSTSSSGLGFRNRKLSLGGAPGDASGGGRLGRRFAASTNDIVGLATNGSSEPITAPRHHRYSRGSISRSGSKTLLQQQDARTRTTSQSSSSTARAGDAGAGVPSLVTTSPGKSRSSLISPRRTPSGIPFFSRSGGGAAGADTRTSKASTLTGDESQGSAARSVPPSPNPSTDAAGSVEEKSGRKSILGLNFRRSKDKDKDKERDRTASTTTGAQAYKRQTIGTTTNAATMPNTKIPGAKVADEFGRRVSGGMIASASTTSLPVAAATSTRRRGKVRVVHLAKCSSIETFWSNADP